MTNRPDPNQAAHALVCRRLDGEDRTLVLAMLFDAAADEPPRSKALSQMNEGTPVPPELRAMVYDLSARGYENSAIQIETGLSRQAISGLINGARRRAIAEAAVAR